MNAAPRPILGAGGAPRPARPRSATRGRRASGSASAPSRRKPCPRWSRGAMPDLLRRPGRRVDERRPVALEGEIPLVREVLDHRRDGRVGHLLVSEIPSWTSRAVARRRDQTTRSISISVPPRVVIGLRMRLLRFDSKVIIRIESNLVKPWPLPGVLPKPLAPEAVRDSSPRPCRGRWGGEADPERMCPLAHRQRPEDL